MSRRAALADECRRFIRLAWDVDRELRDFLRQNGGYTPLPTVAHAWHDVVPQKGEIEGIGRYWFHGIGCALELGETGTIDVDWDPDGNLIVDAYKIRRWLIAIRDDELEEPEIVSALQVLAGNGEVEPTSWPAHFTALRRGSAGTSTSDPADASPPGGP